MEIYGTILQYKHFAVHDGDGIRTTLFLKGCPLSCAWCHNPEGIGQKPQLGYLSHKCINCGECSVCPSSAHSFRNSFDIYNLEASHEFKRDLCSSCGKCAELCLGGALTLYGHRVSATDAAREMLYDRKFYEESGGGITLSGGEPLMQPEFCAEIFKVMRENGIHTALDTCGYVKRESLQLVLPYTSQVLYDIKAANSKTHERFTGRPNELIIDNLYYIDSQSIPIEIRIPLIPGVNSDEADDIGQLLAPLHSVTAVRILPYHKYATAKYDSLGMRYRGEEFEVPSTQLIRDFTRRLESFGLKTIATTSCINK